MKPHDKIAHMKTVDNLLTRRRNREAEANSLKVPWSHQIYTVVTSRARQISPLLFSGHKKQFWVKYVIWFRGKLWLHQSGLALGLTLRSFRDCLGLLGLPLSTLPQKNLPCVVRNWLSSKFHWAIPPYGNPSFIRKHLERFTLWVAPPFAFFLFFVRVFLFGFALLFNNLTISGFHCMAEL